MTFRRSSRSESWNYQVFLGLLLGGSLIAAVLLLQLLLPWLLLGGLGVLLFAGWRRYRQRERQYHALFYQLLLQRGGRISALDFAMTAQLTGQEARRFLDARAKEFCGNFEPTQQGDVLYTFDAQDLGYRGADPSSSTVADPGDLQHPKIQLDGHASLPDGTLTLAQMATRLNCSLALLQQRKWAADFAYWIQDHDPEGRAWRVDPIADRCYPLDRT